MSDTFSDAMGVEDLFPMLEDFLDLNKDERTNKLLKELGFFIRQSIIENVSEFVVVDYDVTYENEIYFLSIDYKLDLDDLLYRVVIQTDGVDIENKLFVSFISGKLNNKKSEVVYKQVGYDFLTEFLCDKKIIDAIVTFLMNGEKPFITLLWKKKGK